MLKIITDLNDYEIAKLKWQKRAMWHCNLRHKPNDPSTDITSSELQDRGIMWNDKHMEYRKRPPHDKYL